MSTRSLTTLYAGKPCDISTSIAERRAAVETGPLNVG
jgi:hypothetical protein